MSKERIDMTDEEREEAYQSARKFFRRRALRPEREAARKFGRALSMTILYLAIGTTFAVFGATNIGLAISAIGGYEFGGMLLRIYKEWDSARK